MEVEVHPDIRVQPPLHRSGASRWNTGMAGEVSTLMDGISDVVMPNGRNTVRWVGKE